MLRLPLSNLHFNYLSKRGSNFIWTNKIDIIKLFEEINTIIKLIFIENYLLHTFAHKYVEYEIILFLENKSIPSLVSN